MTLKSRQKCAIEHPDHHDNWEIAGPVGYPGDRLPLRGKWRTPLMVAAMLRAFCRHASSQENLSREIIGTGSDFIWNCVSAARASERLSIGFEDPSKMILGGKPRFRWGTRSDSRDETRRIGIKLDDFQS